MNRKGFAPIIIIIIAVAVVASGVLFWTTHKSAGPSQVNPISASTSTEPTPPVTMPSSTENVSSTVENMIFGALTSSTPFLSPLSSSTISIPTDGCNILMARYLVNPATSNTTSTVSVLSFDAPQGTLPISNVKFFAVSAKGQKEELQQSQGGNVAEMNGPSAGIQQGPWVLEIYADIKNAKIGNYESPFSSGNFYSPINPSTGLRKVFDNTFGISGQPLSVFSPGENYVAACHYVPPLFTWNDNGLDFTIASGIISGGHGDSLYGPIFNTGVLFHLKIKNNQTKNYSGSLPLMAFQGDKEIAGTTASFKVASGVTIYLDDGFTFGPGSRPSVLYFTTGGGSNIVFSVNIGGEEHADFFRKDLSVINRESPNCTFSANPATLYLNDTTATSSTNIQWLCASGALSAEECSISDQNGKLLVRGSASGTLTIKPEYTSSYFLSCFNKGGDIASSSVEVQVFKKVTAPNP